MNEVEITQRVEQALEGVLDILDSPDEDVVLLVKSALHALRA